MRQGVSLSSIFVGRICRSAVLLGALLGVLGSTTASAQGKRAQRGQVASLMSDEPDYGPGMTATLTGSGFFPRESVTLRVVHADGTPSTGADHDPWTVTAGLTGRFVTTWHVCEDDCVGAALLATADGATSGLHAQQLFTDSHNCGTGVVISVIPVGGSCTAFTPAVGAGPDNYEVAEGGTYTMTIADVSECTGDTITVFIQSSDTGNFCFNATGGGGVYSGTFTMPDPACNTMPISYKCGASATCSHPNSLAAQGPTSGCGGVHLRASTFDANCVKTGDDTDCSHVGPTGACCLVDGSCVEVAEADCLALGGTYRGDSSVCSGVTCPLPAGACCLASGTCVQTTEADCAVQGGVFQGEFSLCKDTNCPPPLGACCLTSGVCVELSESDCAAQGGTYNGDFSTCANVTCSPPNGACCLVDGTCLQVDAATCAARGGTYNGDFSTCGNVSCPDLLPDCFLLDFNTDDEGNPMVHGAKVDTEFNGGPNFPVTITSTVNNSGLNTAAILNSSTGPAMQDPDLLVSKGNILIMENDADLVECPPNSGVYCSHNDDENGGTLRFAFNVPVSPFDIVLIDIDATDPGSSVVLTDVNGKTRTFTVPTNWTGDRITNGPPGYRTLSFVTLANQPGFASIATGAEQAGFNPTAVLQIDVHLGGSGAIDDLSWCQ